MADYEIPNQNFIIVDSKGVVYIGRDNVDEWKQPFANETAARTLEDAMAGADILVGLSKAGAVTIEHIKLMNPKPIVFALALPNPEIDPSLI